MRKRLSFFWQAVLGQAEAGVVPGPATQAVASELKQVKQVAAGSEAGSGPAWPPGPCVVDRVEEQAEEDGILEDTHAHDPLVLHLVPEVPQWGGSQEEEWRDGDDKERQEEQQFLGQEELPLMRRASVRI